MRLGVLLANERLPAAARPALLVARSSARGSAGGDPPSSTASVGGGPSVRGRPSRKGARDLRDRHLRTPRAELSRALSLLMDAFLASDARATTRLLTLRAQTNQRPGAPSGDRASSSSRPAVIGAAHEIRRPRREPGHRLAASRTEAADRPRRATASSPLGRVAQLPGITSSGPSGPGRGVLGSESRRSSTRSGSRMGMTADGRPTLSGTLIRPAPLISVGPKRPRGPPTPCARPEPRRSA